jgi:hypothetical protein
VDLNRKDREELCQLSLQLYGRKYAWQKMMKKGEWIEETQLNKNGNPTKVKRWQPLTLEQVLEKMLDQEYKNQEAAKKVAAEKEAKNGKETSQTQEVSGPGTDQAAT